jgi:hypothetical protein
MGSQQFDKQIKDKLQFHKSEVGPDLWGKIEAGLPEKAGRRPFPFFRVISLSVIFMLVFSSGFLYMYNHLPEDAREIKAISGNIGTKKTPPYAGSKTSSASTDQHTGQLAYENAFANKTNHIEGSQTLVTLAKNVQTKGKNSDNSNLSLKSNLISPVEESSKENNTFTFSEDEKSGKRSVEDIPANLSGSAFNLVKPSGFNTKKIIPKDACLNDFNRSRKGLDLELYYGNDLPIRSMKAKSEEFTQLVNSRKNTESLLYSFSLGARLGFNLSQNFRILTGAHYSQINEKFEFVDPESSQTKIVKTILYIKDGQGNIKDSTFTFDTIYIPGTLVYKIRNQYTAIDVPLLFGYQVLKGEKINLYINLGVMANLIFQKEGMALVDNQYSVRSFSNTSGKTFNNSLGISSYVGAQFAYRFMQNTDLFFEPNIRIQHRGLTSKDYPVSHRYTTISFLTGVRYNF